MNEKSSRESQERIRQLVAQLLDLGCDVTAIGQGYTISEPEGEIRRKAMLRLLREFGPRNHLVGEISDYLKSIGRFIDVD